MGNYRVIRPAPKPQTPIEALNLSDDITRLDLMIDCLTKIRPESVCKEREDGEGQIRSWLVTLRKARQYAQDRLRRDFLVVEPPPKIN